MRRFDGLWTERDVARLLSLLEGDRAYYQTILDAIGSGVAVLSADLRILAINQAFGARYAGQSDILGKALEAVLPTPRLREEAARVLASGSTAHPFLLPLVREGQERLLLASLAPFAPPAHYSAGEETLVLIVDDVPRELLPREAAREPEAVLAPPGAAETTEAAREMLATLEELRKETERLRESEKRLTAQLEVAEAQRRRLEEESAERLRDAEARIADLLRAAESARRLEPALRAAEEARTQAQAEKLEALRRVAGHVAGDFNNYLTTILGYCEFTLDRLGGNGRYSPFARDLEEIKRAGERAAALARQLLAFSQRQPLEPRALSLNAVVQSMEGILRRILGTEIGVLTALADDLRAVLLDPALLEQAILNLALNARDAMPEGGRLTIQAANRDISEEEGPPAGLKAGSYVTLTVSDTGRGMSPEQVAHLFEPFFTTKEKGAGLALATLHGFVRQSGGQVSVNSQREHGTSFTLWFPSFEGSVAPAEPPRTRAAPAVFGAEWILLLEPEEGLRNLVRNTLQRKGYTVLEASQPEQAQRHAEEHRGRIDLMVAEAGEDPAGSQQIVRGLRDTQPEMKVLYLSASFEPGTAGIAVEPGVAVLLKPFGLEELLRKVREVLSRPAGE